MTTTSRLRPILLPEEGPGFCRWGYNPMTREAQHEDGLRDMCDHGARRFKEGYCDLVNFDCMPGEVQQIKEYMADKYPEVRIAFGSARRTLAMAVEQWEKETP